MIHASSRSPGHLPGNCGMEIMDDRCGVWCPGSLDRLTGIVELPSMPRKYPPGLRRNTSERISRVRRLRGERAIEADAGAPSPNCCSASTDSDTTSRRIVQRPPRRVCGSPMPSLN
jgi:hypothetical protein